MLRFLFLALALTVFRADAFNVYRLGANVVRWNANNPGLHTNVFNPVTKAIRYYIASDAYSATNRTAEIHAVRAAFDQWQLIAGTAIKFEFAGFVSPAGIDARFDNTNVVFWSRTPRVAGGTQDMTGRRAWASVTFSVNDGSILDADIVLNGLAYTWYTDHQFPAGPQTFVESAVIHEIGHLLGLDHSAAGGATVMHGGAGLTTELGLSADDIAAARYLNPAANTPALPAIRGKVRRNGASVFGAQVLVEDTSGNVVNETVTDVNGDYFAPVLTPGSYRVRAYPFDPPSLNGLLRGDEIAGEYASAQTAFLATTNYSVTVAAAQTQTVDISVAAAEPPFRIIAISRPSLAENNVTLDRTAVTMAQGQSNLYVGAISRGFQNGFTLTITGDGISHGPTKFLADKFGPGLHALVTQVSVSSNAPVGLRSFRVAHSSGVAYANGYFEVAPAIPDFNFDGLDDRFQRLYWSPWTTNTAAPAFDADGDSLSNGYEYRTGTNPANRNSFLLRLDRVQMGRLSPSVSWPADLGKRYQVLASTNLPASAWQPVAAPVTATNETMSLADPNRASLKFYRLQLLP